MKLKLYNVTMYM